MHLKRLALSHSSKLTRSYFELNHRHTCPSVDLNYQFLLLARQYQKIVNINISPNKFWFCKNQISISNIRLSIVAFNTNHIIAICHDISVTDKPDNINKLSISTLHQIIFGFVKIK